MIIRKANKTDLKNIMKMYKSCVTGMLKNGIDQWDDSYPNTEIISEDLNVGTYYVVEMDGTIIGNNKTGGINVIDLANIYSCPFIATQDLGKLFDDDSFSVLGRFDNADVRGCNLLVQ